MNVIFTCGVPARKVSEKIFPLAELNQIKKIYVISDNSAPKHDKIIAIKTPTWIKIRFLRHLYRFYKLITIGKKVDVIISSYLIPHGILAFFAAKLLKKKIVIGLVGKDFDVDVKKSKFHNFYIDVLNKCDATTVRGTKSKKELSTIGVDTIKIFHPQNLPDFSKFYNANKKKDYDIVYVGRLNSEKGPDFFIDICNELRDLDIRCAIVGCGPMRESLLEKIQEYKLNNINFIDHTDKIEDIFHRSKMYVLTSKREGLPSTLIESMLCGVVPVIIDVGNVRDVANEKNSVIVKHRDVNIFAEEIRYLISDQQKMIKLSNNATSIKSRCSIKVISKDWEKIINFI